MTVPSFPTTGKGVRVGEAVRGGEGDLRTTTSYGPIPTPDPGTLKVSTPRPVPDVTCLFRDLDRPDPKLDLGQ